jgi:beta-N-acetylhexosaminidase
VKSLREKIGQLILVGVQGETLSAEERFVFEEYRFGGVVLFKRNCGAPGQIVSLCRSIWNLTGELPPFIAIDQEGGRVHRLPPPFTHFPPAALIGDRNDPELARRAGRATAAELALAGINLNFAPVLDVDADPRNPIIGDRAFAANPRTVMKLGWAWTEGLIAGGVIPCGKHFPGHGAADKDSHFDLPVVAKSAGAMAATELVPFVHACRNKIDALMTAHIIYPGLDCRWPATLSEKIVTGLLRQQLGYGGVIFSDDMEMKAISDRYGVEEAAHLSLRAGVDGLLFCHGLYRAVQACEFLRAQCEQDGALRARADESCARVARLKRQSLKSFTGAPENEILEQLARLDHEFMAAGLYGSL